MATLSRISALSALSFTFLTQASALYTSCPPFSSGVIPLLSQTDPAQNPGWYKGFLLDYTGDDHVRSFVNKTCRAVFAEECYKAAACENLDNDVGFISWQSRGAAGKKGPCIMFRTSTCSPRYAPNVAGYFDPNAYGWYSTRVDAANANCDS